MDGTSSDAGLVALLGPTNTGKTHRAIRRMLGRRTGMIGLPLRLLAREVYERVKAEAGEGAVALVTGEEKRVPAGASVTSAVTVEDRSTAPVNAVRSASPGAVVP